MAELDGGTTISGFPALHMGNFDTTNVARIVTGSFSGDGTASRTIGLGFTPKFVYIVGDGSTTTTGAGFGLTGATSYGMGKYNSSASQSIYKMSGSTGQYYPLMTTNGFIVTYVSYGMNVSGYAYYYVAIG